MNPGRTKKIGLDYFPFDVDFFNDEKVICIAGEFGNKGELTIIKLLCAIYRNGYFIEWSESLQFSLLRQLPGVSLELLNQIVNRLVRWGFFDVSLFDSVKVLTSVGIQRRYFHAARGRAKKDDYPYLLIDAKFAKNVKNDISYTEIPISDTEMPISDAEMHKRKENKIKKISPDGDIQKSATRQHSLFDEEEKKSKKQKPKTIKATEQPYPSLEEVLQYFLSQDADKRLQDWELSARRFFDNYDSVGWRDKYNRRITRWDSKANNWILSDEKRQKEELNKHEQSEKFRPDTPSGGVPIRGKITPNCGLKRRNSPRET